jgi:cbb3-type cytochrome oxidase subunit 3
VYVRVYEYACAYVCTLFLPSLTAVFFAYWRDLIGHSLTNAARFAGKKAVYVVAVTTPVFLVLLIGAAFMGTLGRIIYTFFYSIYGVVLGVYFVYASHKVKQKMANVPKSKANNVTAKLVRLARIVAAINFSATIISFTVGLTSPRVSADIVMLYVLASRLLALLFVCVLSYAFWPRRRRSKRERENIIAARITGLSSGRGHATTRSVASTNSKKASAIPSPANMSVLKMVTVQEDAKPLEGKVGAILPDAMDKKDGNNDVTGDVKAEGVKVEAAALVQGDITDMIIQTTAQENAPDAAQVVLPVEGMPGGTPA